MSAHRIVPNVKTNDPFLWLKPELVKDSEEYEDYRNTLIRRLRAFFAQWGNRTPDEEIQECWARLIERIAGPNPPYRLLEEERKAYLLTIAINVRLEWHRDNSKYQPPEAAPAPRLPPIKSLTERCIELYKEGVHTALPMLSDADRAIVVRRMESDSTWLYKILAHEKGISHEAMRARGARASARFLDHLRAWPRYGDLARCLRLGEKP